MKMTDRRNEKWRGRMNKKGANEGMTKMENEKFSKRKKNTSKSGQ